MIGDGERMRGAAARVQAAAAPRWLVVYSPWLGELTAYPAWPVRSGLPLLYVHADSAEVLTAGMRAVEAGYVPVCATVLTPQPWLGNAVPRRPGRSAPP